MRWTYGLCVLACLAGLLVSTPPADGCTRVVYLGPGPLGLIMGGHLARAEPRWLIGSAGEDRLAHALAMLLLREAQLSDRGALRLQPVTLHADEALEAVLEAYPPRLPPALVPTLAMTLERAASARANERDWAKVAKLARLVVALPRRSSTRLATRNLALFVGLGLEVGQELGLRADEYETLAAELRRNWSFLADRLSHRYENPGQKIAHSEDPEAFLERFEDASREASP